jgi:ketosteroid isomerase-like protein
MEIQELISRESIRATLARYNLSGDRGRLDELAACFAPDGVMEIEGEWTATGRDAIVEKLRGPMRELSARSQRSLLRHHLSTQGIELTGPDEARAWTYFVAHTEIGPDHSGRYVDLLRCIDGEWLFAHRRVVIEWRSPQSRMSAGTALSPGDHQAICELKARYFRLMDQKNFDAWAELFTEDARLDVSDDVPGGGILEGRSTIRKGVERSLGKVLSVHHGHMPELERSGPDTARGTWTMEDTLDWPDGRSVHGRGLYFEEYKKLPDATWRIASLSLRRLHLLRDGKRVIPK